jgi:hypothetical protein
LNHSLPGDFSNDFFYQAWLAEVTLRRMTPPTISAIARIRPKVTGSLNANIPRIAVPAAPMPVQIA